MINRANIRHWLFVVVLLGLAEFLTTLYFTTTIHGNFGFTFTNAWWQGLLFNLLLLVLVFIALARKAPMWLLLHVFFGPYFIFHPYGAVAQIDYGINHIGWFALEGMINGLLVIFYFTLAILTFFLWLIHWQREK